MFCRMAQALRRVPRARARTRSAARRTSSRSTAGANMLVILVGQRASGEGGPNGSSQRDEVHAGHPDRRGQHAAARRSATARRTTTTVMWVMAFNTPFKMWKRY